MATLRNQAFPLADYPTGTFQFGPVNIRTADKQIYFEVRRCTTVDLTIWPNQSTRLDIKLEISFDNGATWQGLAGFGALGGIHTTRLGVEAPISTLTVSAGTGPQRRLRGSATVVTGPLRSEGFVELRD